MKIDNGIKTNMKKIITRSNIVSIIIVLTMVFLLISPNAKAFLIEGLMKIGLFQPDISQDNQTPSSPDISFKDEKGQIIVLSSLKGKVAFINFWATWCPPCIAEMTSINQLYTQVRTNQNIVIIPVDVDNDFTKSVPFMTKNKYILPVYNTNGEMPEGLLSGAIPTTIIIDKSGKIVFRHEGPADYTNKGFTKYLTDLGKR
ncbi:MAG TPA: TlpA family protein disulfide reductase [Mucilaginibacter sp.]|nr:TlpA family protein disulfide reductase [Mucilaginibacter sp.]